MRRIIAAKCYMIILLSVGPLSGSYGETNVQETDTCVVRCAGLFPEDDGLKVKQRKSCVEGCSSLGGCSGIELIFDGDDCQQEMYRVCNKSCETAYDSSTGEFACKMGCGFGVKSQQVTDLVPFPFSPADSIFHQIRAMFDNFMVKSDQDLEVPPFRRRLVFKIVALPDLHQIEIDPSGAVFPSSNPFGFLFNGGAPPSGIVENTIDTRLGNKDASMVDDGVVEWRRMDKTAIEPEPVRRLVYSLDFVRNVPPLMSLCLLSLGISMVVWMCLLSPAKKAARMQVAATKAHLLKQSEAQFIVAVSGCGKPDLPMDLPPAYDDATTLRVNLDPPSPPAGAAKEGSS